MATDSDGVHIKITGDSSQAVKAFEQVEKAADAVKDTTVEVKVDTKVDALGRLHKANGQFMTMGEKLASSFNSAFMKKAAELSVKASDLGKKIEGTFAHIFKSITGMASSVAGAVGFITKNALAIGGGFEAQMTSVKVISGATADELDTLTAKAREMGATLPITAQNAAQAMTVLAQRGNDAQKILASVTAVANLSISQAVDMAAAADILGSTITNFAMSVDEADKITAVFNNACNQSALSMSKLIEAMKYVGPAAGSVGMELTEAVSAMEAIANAGLTGEMTGTGLAMVLSKLAAKSHIMGVETHNLDGSMRSLKDIFSELQAKGFSLADAIAAFGQRGSKAALALAKNSASIEYNQERLKQWNSTQNAVNEKMKTFTNTLNAFQSATEELHIEIFEQIKNHAKDAVGSVADLTRQFSKWVHETNLAGKALDAFLHGLGFNIPSADNFNQLLNSLDVQKFVDSIQSFGSALKGIADGIVTAFNLIKTPLLFLIEHLGLFATISFWGWILGKGLQVPAAILGIAASFKELYSVIQMLMGLKAVSFLTALVNPLTALTVVAAGLTIGTAYEAGQAYKARKDLDAVIENIQKEIADADNDLQLHLNVDFETGFEKLPESYIKASDELRAKTNETLKELQAAFRDKYAKALDDVSEKFPELTAAAIQSGIDINNASRDVLRQISSALKGSKEDFEALPEFFQKIAESINLLDSEAGNGSKRFSDMLQFVRDLKIETEKALPTDKTNAFFDELSASLRNVLEDIPNAIGEANKFLQGSNGKLAIDVSLEQAQSKLKQFIKDIANRYAIPELVVKEGFLNKLKEAADKGNRYAQILVRSWEDVNKPLNDFLDHAKDAINYLGESPQKFIPALTSLMNGIQKIDPVTGKLTEGFKKARDTLKEWSNVTFDKLTNRIQKLRKAVEGGFIDQSALEKEYSNLVSQLKVQVVTELQPMQNQFSSQSAYYATIAAELHSRLSEIGGEVMGNMLKSEMQKLSVPTGEAIGQAIVRDVQNGLKSQININGLQQNSSTISVINGIPQSLADAVNTLGTNARDMANVVAAMSSLRDIPQNIREAANNFWIRGDAAAQALAMNSQLSSINDFPLALNNAINPLVSRIEQLNTTQGSSLSNQLAPLNSGIQKLIDSLNNSATSYSKTSETIMGLINSIRTPNSNNVQPLSFNDYSSNFAEVIQDLASLNSTAQSGITALNAVEAAVKAIQLQPVDENNISQAVINGVNPFISRFDAYQSANEDFTRQLQTLSSYLDALRKSTDDNVNAVHDLQYSLNNANSSGNNESFSGAIVPLVNAVQSLEQGLSNVLISQQSSLNTMIEMLNSVRELHDSLRNLNSGNTFNIDINQQGFVVEDKTAARNLAQDTVRALRSGLGNGGI